MAYSNSLREDDGYTLISRVLHHRGLYLIKELLRNYAQHFSAEFFFLTGDPNLRHGTGKTGVLFLSFAPLLLLGILAVVRNSPMTALFLLFWWLAALLPASVPLELPHALRSLNGMGVLALFCGVGLSTLFQWSQNNAQKGRWILGVYAVVFLANFGFVVFDYVALYPHRSAEAWADGNKQVAEFVAQKQRSAPALAVAGDEKMFLWTLFFGDYSGSEMQAVPSQKYRQLSIRNVSFGGDALARAASGSGTLIIGTRDELKGMGINAARPIVGQSGKELYWYAKK